MDIKTAQQPVRQFGQTISREQLITIGDLSSFKYELLADIKKLLGASGSPGKKWLKSVEVRKLLGVSTNTLTNMRINGHLPFTKIGGVIYYDYDDIQEMLQGNKNDKGLR